jgi:hypothetical protein
MKYILLLSMLFLCGCEHSILLVKAVRVKVNGQELVRCGVQSSGDVSKSTLEKADELCKDIQGQSATILKK